MQKSITPHAGLDLLQPECARYRDDYQDLSPLEAATKLYGLAFQKTFVNEQQEAQSASACASLLVNHQINWPFETQDLIAWIRAH